jgi:hypothetical protein
MTSQTEIRLLLRPEVLFVPAANPDRPAPAHVLNNFVLEALGRTSGSELVRRLSRAGNATDVLVAHPGVARAAWSTNRATVSALASDIRTVFDPDRRVFPSEGSPIPIDWRLATPDRSDDGFGAALWRSLPTESRPSVAGRLHRLLDTEAQSDPASRLARFVLLAAGDGVGTIERHEAASANPPLGRALDRMLTGLMTDASGARRLELVRELAVLLYFSAVLGVISEGTRHVVPDGNLADLIGAVVYTGLPPGPPDDPLVRAAQLSYRKLVSRAHTGLREALGSQVAAGIDPAIPEDVRLQSWALARLRNAPAENADRSLLRLQADIPFVGADGVRSPDEWVAAAFETGYSVEHLTRAVRVMGTKVGFVGPVRGIGRPRFVLETPLLATITRSLVQPDNSVPFHEFVVRARERLGLIIGGSRLEDLPLGAMVFPSERVARQQLAALEERLRIRMIQAGLAREFSDDHTQVFAE